MPKMTLKGLEKTVQHYIESEDYIGARNYVKNFADEFNSFDKEKALGMITNAEKGIETRIKKEIKEVKEE